MRGARRTASAGCAAAAPTIRSTSGMNPMSSMRSASSITRIFASLSRMRAALEHVDQPAGRGDQHVDAAHQHVLLVGHALAADDQRVRQLQVLAVLDEVLGDLQRQFARRLQDQAARHPRAGARAGEDVEHRQGEAGGLAGAGLCRAQHVASHQHERDRLFLDRRRVAVAHSRRPRAAPVRTGRDRRTVVRVAAGSAAHRCRRVVGRFRRGGQRVGQILVQSCMGVVCWAGPRRG